MRKEDDEEIKCRDPFFRLWKEVSLA